MSIRVRGSRAYQVRVEPFPLVTLPTREAAETVELDLKLRKKMGALYREQPTTFGAELDAYLARKCARRPLRAASVEFYEKGAKPWAPFRATLVCNLRRSHIEDHIARRACKAPVAARNELTLARSVLREAASRGQMVDPGILEIPAVRVEHAEGKTLEREQILTLQAWLPERLGRIVPLVASLGLRLTEALSLRDEMLNLEARTLLVPRELNKSRRAKPIDLARYEAQLLREQMMARPAGTKLLFPNEQGEMYSASGFRHQWYPAVEKAGLKPYKFHWLRHTAISNMARAGMPVEKIASRVGHSDGGALILRTYRHMFDDEARAAVDRLDAFLDGQERVAGSAIAVVEG